MPEAKKVLWVMLNPSTADENVLDPTLRRCCDYAHGWGYGGFEVTNLFAYRSTDPHALRQVEDPVGPENDEAIRQALEVASLVMVAWGGFYLPCKKARVETVLGLLTASGKQKYALACTQKGDPAHPLYLKALLQPVLWTPRR